MTQLILYIAESTVCLAFFMGVYYLMLKRDTYFHWTRCYLLVGLIISSLLPLLEIPVAAAPSSSNLPVQWLSTVTITSATATDSISQSLSGTSLILASLFSGISLILLIRLVMQWVRLFKIKSNGQKTHWKRALVVYSNQVEAPFNFLNTIYLPAQSTVSEAIIYHEFAHINHRHSIDILIVKGVWIIQWANPFLHLLLRELRNIHEYQADREVLKQGVELGDYRNVLLQNLFNTPQSFLVNSFYFSNLKNRYLMMTQDRPKSQTILKTGIAVPVIVSLLFVFIACENSVVDNSNDGKEITETQQDEQGNNDQLSQQEQATADSDSVYQIVDEMPEYPGGERKLMAYLGKVDYPESAKEENLQGQVYVKFIIDKSGNIESADIARGTNSVLDSVALEHVRKMPKWEPGRKADGEKVRVQYVVPFRFKLDEEKEES